MKILVLSSHTHSLFWFRIDMMKNFLQKGCDVVAVGDEAEEVWVERFAGLNIKYRQVYVKRNGINPCDDLKTLKQIRNILKEEKPDKVFLYQAKSIIYGCIAASALKMKEMYPLVAGLGSVFRGKTLKSKLVKFIMGMEYKIALRNSKKVMFQNKDDLNLFVEEKIVNPDKCCIINGSGVDVRKFELKELPQETAFLMIARLIRDKGVVEYLEACKEIKNQFPNCRCMLVGPFDTNPSALQPEELQSYIDENIIEYYGEQDDVRSYIEQCSVFVLPSYHEGTPKTVLEAMAMGRAVITTDAPGCRETVQDGDNGYLIPVKNTQQLVARMKYFIENSDKAFIMGQKGRKIAEAKYDVDKVNEAILKIMSI